jgi:hypothetical protein
MVDKLSVPFLKRCGLTFHELAKAACLTEPREPEDRLSFSIQMLNDVKLSNCDHPSVPTATGRLELVRVELRDDLLTIADIKGERRTGDRKVMESVGARLYARKAIPMQGATAFTFLSEPPPGVADDKFFAAQGTVVLYGNARKGPRVLKACGTDRNNGQCIGWIFDATET